METVVERWNIHPDLKWLRGVRPESEVEYDERLNAWFVYGYQDVYDIINDPGTFSNKTAQLAAVQIDESFAEGDLSQLDPPEQTRYRKLISRAFTPKVVAGLAPRITAITAGLIDAMRGRDRVDLVPDLAYPLPVIVIAELLGIPAGDHELFMAHSTTVIEQMNGLSFLDAEAEADVGHALEQFLPMLDYLRAQIAERRAHPRDDLLSRLILAEEDGQRLSDNEIVNLTNILLGAGHITTTMLIGNAMTCLDANPDQLAQLRCDRTLVPGALDEALRTLSPSAGVSRRNTTAVELSGVRLPPEQMILPWIAAANRDPRTFTDPDTFDIRRTPNPHLSFGHGVHFCIGSHLARLEARIAINALLDAFPTLRTDPTDPPVFFPTPDLIGPKSLPMRTRD
ncbi:MAG TPA: cytochrome P450 [Actinophytocola sp.]|uniref:cytochrome P450 n=1 Tax=Actinophytocola sp. TaxID=1872138 RepID=UPI002DBE3C55|nr:cytochrome P450 [Actinophytocola sp.]HEU5471988.1 cytochrome P450 [Actinophytocola sp.]